MFPNLTTPMPMATEGLAPSPEQPQPLGLPTQAVSRPDPLDMPDAPQPAGAPGMPSVPGMGVQGPTPPSQMELLAQEIAKSRAEIAARRQQHEQFLQQMMTTDGLSQYLPKPSAKQMLSDALTNFGMARLTKGNFEPIQTRRFDEAFKRHGAAVQNAQLALSADRQDELSVANMESQSMRFQQLAERQANDEGRRDLTAQGLALKEKLANQQTHSIAGNLDGASLKTLMPVDSLGNPVKDELGYKAVRDNKNNIIAAYPAQMSAAAGGKPIETWYKDPNSSTGYTSAFLDPSSGAVRFAVQNRVPPSYLLPTISQSMKFVMQPDNTWQAVPVENVRTRDAGKAAPLSITKPGKEDAPTPTPPTTSAPARTPPGRTPALPGSTPPAAQGQKPADAKMAIGMLYDDQGRMRVSPSYGGSGPARAGQTVGGRGLAPGQRMAAEGSASAMDLSADRLATVLHGMDRISGLIDSGKLWLASRPDGLVLASRAYNLSPEDEKVAAAFVNLTEDVNILRKPFNATGFRGPEAFAALQSQKGNLLARPGVMRETIMSTLKAIQGQRKAIDAAMSPGQKPTPNAQVVKNYIVLAGGKADKAAEMLAADGYKVE